ncbi:MAG: type I-F CRISPR-associated helicase Cas3 [Selenomonas sp.]|nr:type I-F CRISPR-associated helicase Cas3 [Selenomonas sp.]
MMVIFTSQSDKNALKTTRWILDAFANRIGTDTWQTIITEDGLQMVKTLLRRHATKSMSVSCRWIRSRTHSQLLWIVGDKSRFNEEGIVPVNSTQKDLAHSEWENDWAHLPAIKALAAMAGLLHDWGKANKSFQKLLKKKKDKDGKKTSDEVYRHEWLSCKLLEGLVYQTDTQKDNAWLELLHTGKIPEKKLAEYLKENADKELAVMPPAASMLCWLILSHHRLPALDENRRNNYSETEMPDFSALLANFQADWGYKKEGKDEVKLVSGLLKSAPWKKQLKKWSGRLLEVYSDLQELWQQRNIRPLLLYARVSLMLGDYMVSADKADPSWPQDCTLYANTDKNELKQRLDEHLVRVGRQAAKAARCLPRFAEGMERIEDVPALQKKSRLKNFYWQDKVTAKIQAYRKEHSEIAHEGWFVINMAGTGCGKTFANAKIMRALSRDGKSLRYSLLLGLRTLTLQTGKEYRSRVKLDSSEMAVLVGSAVVKDLYEDEVCLEDTGDTACMNELLSGTVQAKFSAEDEMLDVLFDPAEKMTDEKRQLLYAPVLVATIDHLMPSVETVRGGRHILPFLRLMAADVVIDEIDDFAGKDLVAIARLVHLAGLLGRNIVLSSATIPPDLAEGLFSAYWRGRQEYAQFFGYKNNINCVWCDEFQPQVQTIGTMEQDGALLAYRQGHKEFSLRHLEKLKSQPIKRRGWIVDCEKILQLPQEERKEAYFQAMQQAIVRLHNQYAVKDKRTGKRVSFGLVRVANILPCVQAAKYMLKSEWPEKIAPRLLVYHSRQTALLRSQEEKYLDRVLKRNGQTGTEIDFQDALVRRHIEGTEAQDIIFILVATPVEELGRDHDFDWAVVEPSSYRSLIQLAGRIRRHRGEPAAAELGNIAVMQYNIKALQEINGPVFCRPGFETQEKYRLRTHDMKELVNTAELAAVIDASPRTVRPEKLQARSNLVHLEHKVLSDFRDLSNCGAAFLHGWQEEYWWLTALPQQLNKFREGQQDIELCLREEEGNFAFYEKSSHTGHWIKCEDCYHIKQDEAEDNARFWLKRDYKEAWNAYKGTREEWGKMDKVGLLHLPARDEEWRYSDQFGMYEEKEEFDQ